MLASKSDDDCAGTIERHADGIDDVANQKIVVASTKIIVHPRQCHEEKGFDRDTQVKGAHKDYG